MFLARVYSNLTNMKRLDNTRASFKQLLGLDITAVHIWNYYELLDNQHLIKGKAGTYGVYNIKLNKIYVGKAEDLQRRLHDHAVTGHSSSRWLQGDIVKYGVDSFQFIVFEILPDRERYSHRFKSILHIKEQDLMHSLDHMYQANRMYNASKYSKTILDPKYYGFKEENMPPHIIPTVEVRDINTNKRTFYNGFNETCAQLQKTTEIPITVSGLKSAGNRKYPRNFYKNSWERQLRS